MVPDTNNYFSAPKATGPVWIDDRTLAYVSTQEKGAQIWLYDRMTGRSSRQTDLGDKVWNMVADPGQGQLVFTMDSEGNENEQLYIMHELGAQPLALTDDSTVRHYLGYVRDAHIVYASNARDRRCFDICEMDTVNGHAMILVPNYDLLNVPVCESPDGRYILYNKAFGLTHVQLWCYDRATNRAERIGPVDYEASDMRPVWKGDGTGFYLITDRGHDFKWVGFYDLASGLITGVFRCDWDVTHIALSPDDRYLACVVNEDGYAKLHMLDRVAGRTIESPEPPRGVIDENDVIAWSPAGHRLAFSLTSGSRIPDLWLMDLDADAVSRITDCGCGQMDTESLVEPTLHRYTSFDGLSVPYWLYTPPGAPRSQLPVVIYIHGGPEAQIRCAYEDVLQYLVAQGVAVVAPNIRGSTGYGKTYASLDDVEKRLDCVRDIDALAQHLIDTGVADAGRMAVYGRSYGGFMTLSCAARLPKRWACAVAVVGMFNLVSFLENTAPYRRPLREVEYGSLAEDRQLLYQLSPIAEIDALVCPLMIVHGANDPRVPVGEAEAAVAHLRALGREVDYLRYEDEGHTITKPHNRIDYNSRVAEFLKRHL